jgi:hypothetical protein
LLFSADGVEKQSNVAGTQVRGLTSASRWSGLRHPLWWGALLVLVVNDHLLKGAGVLPGWLTGKLSDVAGLIVAPVLLAALLGAGRRARLVAMAAVGGVFTAIKLSAAAAWAACQLTAAFGVPWQIWCDATDLLALPVLGVAWLIGARPCHAPSNARPRLERAGVLLGGLACMATSQAYTELRTAVFLENRTYFEQRVEIYRAPVLDCTTLGDPRAALDASQFTFEACHLIEPYQRMPLDRDAWSPGSGEPQPPRAPRCDAVIVSTAGLEPTLIFWNDVEQESFAFEDRNDALEAQGVYLEQVGAELFIARGTVANAWLAPGTLPPAPPHDCPAEQW